VDGTITSRLKKRFINMVRAKRCLVFIVLSEELMIILSSVAFATDIAKSNFRYIQLLQASSDIGYDAFYIGVNPWPR
jgi:hypothetical protein